MLYFASTARLSLCREESVIAETVDSILRNHGRERDRVARESSETDYRRERRSGHREPFEIPFYLYPVQKTRHRLDVDLTSPLIALTRDLSARGIGFQVDEHLTGRWMVAEFDSMNGQPYRFLIEIRWSQKKCAHCYRGGAQLKALIRQKGALAEEDMLAPA